MHGRQERREPLVEAAHLCHDVVGVGICSPVVYFEFGVLTCCLRWYLMELCVARSYVLFLRVLYFDMVCETGGKLLSGPLL